MLKKLIALLILTSGFIWQNVPSQAAEPEKDWPCIQVKVPKLSYGVMWAGPAIEGEAADWRQNRKVARLLPLLAARRNDQERVENIINEFAENTDKEKHNVEMTQLFAGAFEYISRERSDVIEGIERFTRKQRQLADKVRETRLAHDQAAAVKDPSEDQKKQLTELVQQLTWETRIFNDREKTLTYVCESPVLIDQRLFFIARQIVNHLN